MKLFLTEPSIHLDLMAHNILPDPFVASNETQVEWVADKTWLYRLALPRINNHKPDTRIVLVFDGLDTFATVTLNGIEILKTDNMFVANRVDVTRIVGQSQGLRCNLEIKFESALIKAREIQKAHPEHKWVCFNGEPARMAVRKAQYHWGWDWGPILNTCGPYLPIWLEQYQFRIADLWTRVCFNADEIGAEIDIFAQIEGQQFIGQHVILRLMFADEVVIEETVSVHHDGSIYMKFTLDFPKLWFPHGYGPQSLYVLEARLVLHDGVVLDSVSKRIGIRTVELRQDLDQHGKSFYFKINGIDIFCGGSDWIPADNFTPRITEGKYRKWLELLRDGNQIMVRVWGGGIWEPSSFYDICDELGILVWQDFLFACGNYPCFPEILKSIEQEAEYQLKRLRHHPSIVVYAGNNEDYQVQEQSGLTYEYADKDPENWLKTDFPARYIYEKILPEAVAKFNPAVSYHPGSPWGDGKMTSDPTVGDLHQWNVWHGTQEKYQIFDTLGGRFNSEFGMQAFPHLETIKTFIKDNSDLYSQSATLDFHNKAAGHERRLTTYVVENLRLSTDLPAYIHLTQVVQAEALLFAYRGWRRQFGYSRKCGGALVWQLNDCWPGVSWSIADYYLRKKPAYYVMARTLAKLAIGVQRTHKDWSVIHARPPSRLSWELWAVSSSLIPVKARIKLRFVSIATGKDIKEAIERHIVLSANGTTDIDSGTIDNTTEEPHVLAAILLVEDKVVARDTDWPQPLKYLSFENRGLDVRFRNTDEIRLTTLKPVKGLVFDEVPDTSFYDNCIDVMPGDDQVIRVHHSGQGPKILSYQYLGKP